MISHRHAKANHPSLNDIGYYDKTKALCQILYLDANNLYGYAMSQFLPISHFIWMCANKLKNVTIDWILSLKHDAEQGYIFEVDFAACSENLSKLGTF